ncbi:MAG: S46 family peptidase, partial [Pseudomonadota bacterium]
SRPARALADAGRWTFENFPAAQVKEKYGATIDQRWLDRVRGGVARLDNGCSASLVSPDGLVLTNHHCVTTCIADRSSPERDLLAKGFLAQNRALEERCETDRVSVLVGTEDVTAKVTEATKGLQGAGLAEARRRTRTQLEQACEDASKEDRRAGPLKCETVELYQGGQTWLYRYKRYDDVRLVFVPENDVAAFGGDPDNFQFPRWCLDMALLRVYENGKPARTPNHLEMDFAGPAEGQATFVAGHPGNTERLLTVEQLLTQRNSLIPFWLVRNVELRGRYLQYARTSPEAERQVATDLFGLENSIKVRREQLDALLDERLFAERRAEEAKLREYLAKSPELAREVGDPWADIAKAQQTYRNILQPFTFVEGGAGFGNSVLFTRARQLVRAAEERAKPNEQRLREYTEARLPALRQTLGAQVPIHPEVENIRIAFGLARMREFLGPDHPVVRRVFGNASATDIAEKLVAGTKLADPATRTALYEGGAAAVQASEDPMIELARSIDAEARALRKRFEDEVDGPTTEAQGRLSRVRFAALGTNTYPDATFTLRLSYGAIAGWREGERTVPAFTTLDRLFERATGQPPFRVPQSWESVKARLDLATRFNTSSTHDIVGGNSGSPMLDAKGNVVGLIFDGNIHSISGTYWYDAELNRAVSVNTQIMREAMSKVYGADALRKELGAK